MKWITVSRAREEWPCPSPPGSAQDGGAETRSLNRLPLSISCAAVQRDHGVERPDNPTICLRFLV